MEAKRLNSKKLSLMDLIRLWEDKRVVNYLKEKYSKEIGDVLDLEKLKKKAEIGEPILVGTVLSFSPLKKYWGSETLNKELVKDIIFWNTFEETLYNYNMYSTISDNESRDVSIILMAEGDE